MAGDWIAIRKDLVKSREVLFISGRTGVDPHRIVGLLVSLWSWADSETLDGTLDGLSADTLRTVCGTVADSCVKCGGPLAPTDAEFWSAVKASGWLKETETGLFIPNFERWFGKGAKRRLLDSERKRVIRESAKSPQPVREKSARQADRKRTTEEKRTEENKESKSHSADAAKDERSRHPAISTVREVMQAFPSRELWDGLIAELGESPDLVKVKTCYVEWLARGYNKHSIKWVEWVRLGIPVTGNGKGRKARTFRPGEIDESQFE